MQLRRVADLCICVTDNRVNCSCRVSRQWRSTHEHDWGCVRAPCAVMKQKAASSLVPKCFDVHLRKMKQAMQFATACRFPTTAASALHNRLANQQMSSTGESPVRAYQPSSYTSKLYNPPYALLQVQLAAAYCPDQFSWYQTLMTHLCSTHTKVLWVQRQQQQH